MSLKNDVVNIDTSGDKFLNYYFLQVPVKYCLIFQYVLCEEYSICWIFQVPYTVIFLIPYTVIFPNTVYHDNSDTVYRTVVHFTLQCQKCRIMYNIFSDSVCFQCTIFPVKIFLAENFLSMAPYTKFPDTSLNLRLLLFDLLTNNEF